VTTATTQSAGETGAKVAAGGITTHYHEAGSGDPVVLLHGSGPGVSGWANWQHTIPALSARFHTLAPDMVGYGYTERPSDIRYGVATWVDHMLSFLDAHGIERTSLVGNSMGGLVSLQIAARHPDRVDRLVLMGTPGPGMAPTEGLTALRNYEPSPQAMRDLMVTYFVADDAFITDELVRARYEASAAPGAHETYHAMFHDPRHSGNDLDLSEDRLRDIRSRTLLVHGQEDKVVPVELSWRMSGLIPNADLHVFGRCGHWTQIERAQQFNTLITDFLSEPASR
jgi:pimeloyl-ACP methyl ester carboxylesterase